MSKTSKLRLITYMVPGYPLALFQLYQSYLEEVLNCHSYLMVESRASGPLQDREDPFTADEADIGFMCSTAMLSCEQNHNQYVDLLPAAPVHIHPKSDLNAVYFSELVVNATNKDKYRSIEDLKGCTWGYNDPISLSGRLSTLAELNKLGYDVSLFGSVIQTGSHHNSIEAILNHTIDAATIDSNVLYSYLNLHPEYRNQIHVLCSWGPLPIPPIVVNTRLSCEHREKITNAFLDMNKAEKWAKELAKFQVWGFKPIDKKFYDVEKEIHEQVKNYQEHET